MPPLLTPTHQQVKGANMAALKSACAYHSGQSQSEIIPNGKPRQLLVDWDAVGNYAVLRAYTITSGAVVKAQVGMMCLQTYVKMCVSMWCTCRVR